MFSGLVGAFCGRRAVHIAWTRVGAEATVNAQVRLAGLEKPRTACRLAWK